MVPASGGGIHLIQALILVLPIAEKVLAIAALKKIQPPPEEPQTSLDLTEQWWQAISSQDVLESSDSDEAGQISFLRYLAEHLPDDYFAVRSPFLQSSLNVDVWSLARPASGCSRPGTGADESFAAAASGSMNPPPMPRWRV